MSVYVFLGPSLPLAEAQTLVDAHFLPPAAAGDLLAILDEKPHAVAIIDGVFQTVPSVWHKEILYALSRGVPVFGASSMGALRAAELQPFGMVGVGRVFELYRDGSIEDDDEVAVAHGPASLGHRPLSEAMVNLRDGLERAAHAGVIRESTCQVLVAASKARFFSERTWAGVDADARALGVPEGEREALRRFLAAEKPNLKREDAVACLKWLANMMARGIVPHQPDFDFNPTRYWMQLEEYNKRRKTAGAQAGKTLQSIALHVRASRPQRREIFETALLLDLLARAPNHFNVAPDPNQVQSAAERLRTDHGARLSEDEVRELATAEAVRGSLSTLWQESIDARTRLALARRGELAAVEDHLERRGRFLQQQGMESPEFDQVGIDLNGLLDWYCRRAKLPPGPIEELAARAGVASVPAFLDEILREYAYVRHLESQR
jgi:hypothetical protein